MTPFATLEARINSGVMAKLSNATAIIGGVRVEGVFDARYDDPLGIAGVHPAFVSAAPAVVAASNRAAIVVTCETLGVVAAPYVVIERQPEHGLMRLLLERGE